jgi:hypothetical protein
MKKVIITGASGFLGKALSSYLMEKEFMVVPLSRLPAKARQAGKRDHKNPNAITWNGKDIDTWSEAFENAHAVINLAGKSVDCRYTEANKKAILSSRIDSTRVLNLALEKATHKPKVFLNASTATIYDHSENRPNTEKDGIIGDDFSMNVAKEWEREFFSTTHLETRKIAMRTSIVLGKGGGAFPKLKQITAAGLGGKQGTGNQMVSWIHIEDFCRAVLFLLESDLEGVVNVTAPNPLANRDFTKVLADKMNATIAIPQPTWLLRIGAAIIGTETELLLKSRYVLPERLQQAGFEWKYARVEECFKELVTTHEI